jgi:hypothetical protein
MTAAGWAVTEAAGAQLGDRRRNAAWACILTALLAGAGRSFSAALGQALRQAASSLFGRPGLGVAELLAGHYQATAERCAAQPLVLVSQDSTCFNYTTRRRTSGLGRLADKSSSRGLWAHSALALTPDGRPLGLLSLRFWSRGERRTKADRRARRYEEKESYKWELALREVEAGLPRDTLAVVLSDRESDVFEYLRAPVRRGLYKLVRAAWPRRCRGLDGTVRGAVTTAVREAAEMARVRVALPAQHGRAGRLAVRWVPLVVRSPRSWPAAEQDELAVAVVAVDEVDPPAGVQPLSWTLLTTWPVANADEALAVVDWYRRRWTVELAHRALKLDGYRVERLQLRTAAALQLALASYWVVAWRAMNLAMEARENPDLPASERFGSDELEVLSRLSGKPVTRLVEAVHEVAKLGGWAGYRSSPPPGTQVVQQGLLLLEPIVRYHRALREPPAGDEM